MQNKIRGVSHVKLPSEGYRAIGGYSSETTNYYRIDSRTIKNGKGNGNSRRINSKQLTDGNGVFTPWYKTVRLDFGTTTHRSHVLPESQCNSSRTSHFWVCVLTRKKLHVATGFRQWNRKWYGLLHFTAMTAWSATTFNIQCFAVFLSAMMLKIPRFAVLYVPWSLTTSFLWCFQRNISSK